MNQVFEIRCLDLVVGYQYHVQRTGAYMQFSTPLTHGLLQFPFLGSDHSFLAAYLPSFTVTSTAISWTVRRWALCTPPYDYPLLSC